MPATVCGNAPQFYFAAMGDGGANATSPPTAPAAVYSSPVGTVQTNTALNVDFDTALPAGWTATGMWHISSGCAPGGSPCTGSQWAYYGTETGANPCTYNTGVANSGDLTSPPITIPPAPAGSPITLTYCSACTTENAPPPGNYDR